LTWKAVASEKDDVEIELRCPEADSRGKFGRVLAEVWVCEDGTWTNVNKWLDKALVEGLHLENRKKLIDRGEVQV